MFKARYLAAGLRTQYVKRKKRLETESGSKLPEAYKKFFTEWNYEKAKPIHYVEEQGRYKLNEQGRVVHVVNLPIPMKYSKEQDEGIWGGEFVIQGYRRPAHRYETPVPEFWVPRLLDHIVYSEILDKYLNVPVTQRTIDLILEHHGFDNYILKTRACDLVSLLACKIKKKILSALFYKTLYPDNEEQREIIYSKYKQYLEGYSEEDIKWYGLSFNEAVAKNNEIEKQAFENGKMPLKNVYRQEFLEELKEMKLDGTLYKQKEKQSLLEKFNPFAKLKET